MERRKALPIALTIAGSDSGGGAGIQADLKTFASLGIHGTCAITCITAQNPKRVRGIQPCSVKIVRAQLEAVFEAMPPAAVKTGMLYSAGIIHTVAEFLRHHRIPLVVDPVMVSTSGAVLLKPAAMKALLAEVLPMATLITPNLPESEKLLGRRLNSVEDLRSAAREMQKRFNCAALVKGGHIRGLTEAVDIFNDGTQELLLSAPFVQGVKTHGTGCTYSAAITGFLSLGFSLSESVGRAKEYISQAIFSSQTAGGQAVLSWSP
jgi:hydroxymethylpyrimidine/phosphomethylpyrimidine kinase